MLVDRKYISVKFSEEQLWERNKPLAILLDMGGLLSTSLDLNKALEGALARVLECFDLNAGRIYLMEENGEFLTLAAYTGVDAVGLERVGVAEGFSGKSVRTRSFIAQHVSELEDEKRAAFLLSKGFKVIICVPLLAMGKVVGVMNLAADRMIEIDQGKIDLLIAIGNQIATAANNIRLYEDIKRKASEINAQKEATEFLAYSISHDLKSPAIGIYGLTKRLHDRCREVLDDAGKLYCEQILKAAGQILTLVDRINTYIMTKEAPLLFESIHLEEITELIHSEFGEALSKRGVKWSEAVSLATIMADRMSLTRVLRNLVDNALKYGGEELREIKIEYKDSDEYHIISVKDDGVALKQEDAESLFGLFHRHETSKGIEGTGLGLAIVKELAERHEGKVWLDSACAKGTTFCVAISKRLKALS